MSEKILNKKLERRQFLKMAGCGAMIAVVGGGCSRINEKKSACPYGRINDPYPGECGSYIDSNGNGICDYSETSTATATLVQPTAIVQNTAVPTNTAVPPTSTAAQATNTVAQPTSTVVQATNTVVPPTNTAVPPTSTAVPPVNNVQSSGQTAVECPRGCRYPGGCRRYVDNNNSGICDRSESA